MFARRISLPAALAAILGAALLVGGCAKPSGGGDTGSGGTSGTGNGGTTGVTCASGQKACSQGCTNVQTDAQNCGACGKVCGTGQTCSAGVCACGTGLLSCGGSCVSSNNTNCGACGTTCSSTQVCSNNACSSSCASGTTACSGGACANLQTDNGNCGTCGTVCSGGSTCTSGACTCAVAGQQLCNSACTDTTSNTSNCGSCGHACTTGQTCTNSVCTNVSTTGTAGTTGSGTGTAGTTGSGTAGTSGSGTAGTTGSTGTGGTASITGDPPGYYKTADWSVTSVDWHGCVWTGKDSTVSGSTTTITPQDFTGAAKEGGPYEVSGTVYNDYNAVALLGFNLNEATTGSSTQCKYNAAAATQAGPPVGTIPSSATGIAVNWSAKKAPPTSFRIQVQGTDGATNAMHVWCATITDAQGPSFIPFTSFYQQCWNVGTTMSPGAQFTPGTNAIDAVAFLVPGTVGMTAPFDFTIVGFAPGTSKADAPGGAQACGTASGTIGSSTASTAAAFQRAAVTGTDCHEYIVQNNNWGNPTGSTQIINYSGTGFTVQSSSGNTNNNNGQPQGAPASFPSTYVGANGNIANGTYNTWSDSGLPKQISVMQSVTTSFAWSGQSGGDFNATYDVWFAKSPPTAGSYDDAVSGFLMVWLYQPSGRQPIGKKVRTTATIAGHTWNVWVGPRGTAAGDGTNRPVVSYVATDSPVASLTGFNLRDFMNDAVTNGASDMSAGGTSQAFASSWYLTDVFAGFEIWTGSSATNLKSTGFSCVVK